MLAEQLREAISEMAISLSDEQGISVTASIGLAHYHGEPLDSLIDRADRAMYTAKSTGRDRVCDERLLDTELLEDQEEEAA